MDRWHWRIAAFIIGLAAVGLATRFAAAAIARHPKTLEVLKTEEAQAEATPPQRKIRILIVPGHEPNSGGTAYRKLKERDLAVELGKDLQRFLEADGRYETVLSRDEHGWNPVIADYFAAHWSEIDEWRKQARAEMDMKIASGEVPKPVVHIGHNDAQHDVAVRLYGITKWANENDIDLMVHVHFDDDRASTRAAGHRTGFAIFVPTPVYFNAAPTRAIAEKVLMRLSAFDPIGNLRGEAGGIVEDPELIAVGEQNTADPASFLTEYAFIYERQLQTPAVRAMALDDMAYHTFLGMEDLFFDGKAVPARHFPTTALPYMWQRPIRAMEDSTDVYALQTALTLDGEYPPPGKTKNACSRTGSFGPCTRQALTLFQTKYGITGETGTTGPKTREKLNVLFAK